MFPAHRNRPQTESPSLALVVPRPLVWLLARGVVRDLTLEVDPAPLLGHPVALKVAQVGVAEGYRRLRSMLEGTAHAGTPVARVRDESPKGAVVGFAVVSRVVPVGGGWRVHLERARPVAAVAVRPVGVEVVSLPQATRAALEACWGSGRP